MTTEFDLGRLLSERGAERYELHTRHLNHQLPRMLRTIGFDKVYERAEGAFDAVAGFGFREQCIGAAILCAASAGRADFRRIHQPLIPDP